MTKECYLTFIFRNVGLWIGNLPLMPIKGFSLFPFVLAKHPEKDLPDAIADSMTYLYSYDPSVVGTIMVSGLIGAFSIFNSAGGLIIDRPYRLANVMSTVLSGMYPTMDYYAWNFFNYPIFTSTSYCSNEGGVYAVKHLLMDIGCLAGAIIAIKYGGPYLIGAMKSTYSSVMNRRKHKALRSGISDVKRSMNNQFNIQRRSYAIQARKARLLALMVENPHLATDQNFSLVR